MKYLFVVVAVLAFTGCTSQQIRDMNEGYERRQQNSSGGGGETQYDRTMKDAQLEWPDKY